MIGTQHLVAPFCISQRQAMDCITKHCRQKLVPKGFVDLVAETDVTSCYIPFYLYGAYVSGTATCLRYAENAVSSSVDGKCAVNVAVSFSKIPAAATADDELNECLNSLEPYDTDNLRLCAHAVLSDCVIEPWGLRAWESCRRPASRMLDSCWNSIEGIFSDDRRFDWLSESADMKVRWESVRRCYLPAWLLRVEWRKRDVLLVVNGQTGEVAGKLPASRLRRVLLQACSAVLFIALAILMMVAWGVFLLWAPSVLDAAGLFSSLNVRSLSGPAAYGLLLALFVPLLGAVGIVGVCIAGHTTLTQAFERRLILAKARSDADGYRGHWKVEIADAPDWNEVDFASKSESALRIKYAKSFGMYCGKESFARLSPTDIGDDTDEMWVSTVRTKSGSLPW